MPASGLYLGIMSGTSLDGVDAALCRFGESEGRRSVELVAEASISWPESVRDLLYGLATEQSVGIDALARAHFLLPYYYAQAAEAAISAAGLTASDVQAIGVHGQTVRHLPKPAEAATNTPAVGATLQIGSGPALAALTGIDVVSDFRSADVALGGQGAPLVPMFDNQFLRTPEADRVALNIGGISNITWLPSNVSEGVLAYDCGPGNMIVDALVRRWFDRPFDDCGKIASEGKVNERLLTSLLSHDYFSAPPPKSTGRELFGHEFLERILDAAHRGLLTREDAVATATELTARSIADAINELPRIPSELLASGGGAKNTWMMSRLEMLLPGTRVTNTDRLGIPAQSKEAIAFAFFAYAFVNGLSIHLAATTGARRTTTLGSLSRGR